MGIARRGSLNMLMPIVRSDRFIFYLDQQIRRRLRGGVRASVKGKADVSEEAVRLRDCEARQVADPVRRGLTCRYADPFRCRERACFHAPSKRPAGYGRSTALVICRAKIALTPRRSLSRRANSRQENYESSSSRRAGRDVSYFFSVRTYATNALISSALSLSPNAFIVVLPPSFTPFLIDSVALASVKAA